MIAPYQGINQYFCLIHSVLRFWPNRIVRFAGRSRNTPGAPEEQDRTIARRRSIDWSKNRCPMKSITTVGVFLAPQR